MLLTPIWSLSGISWGQFESLGWRFTECGRVSRGFAVAFRIFDTFLGDLSVAFVTPERLRLQRRVLGCLGVSRKCWGVQETL